MKRLLCGRTETERVQVPCSRAPEELGNSPNILGYVQAYQNAIQNGCSLCLALRVQIIYSVMHARNTKYTGTMYIIYLMV